MHQCDLRSLWSHLISSYLILSHPICHLAVGVAFQSLGGDADGIGYLIPALVCLNFLQATDSGTPYAWLGLT
jgi:hypothetical protein